MRPLEHWAFGEPDLSGSVSRSSWHSPQQKSATANLLLRGDACRSGLKIVDGLHTSYSYYSEALRRPPLDILPRATAINTRKTNLQHAMNVYRSNCSSLMLTHSSRERFPHGVGVDVPHDAESEGTNHTSLTPGAKPVYRKRHMRNCCHKVLGQVRR